MHRYRHTVLERGLAAAVLGLGCLAFAAPTRADDASGTTAVAQARIGGLTKSALLVQGEYDALRVAAHADLSPRTALTAEAWVKRDPTTGCGTIIGRDRDAGWWFGVCDGRLRFSPGGGLGAAATGQRVLPEGRWAHVAVAYDGVTARFYVDGVPDASVRLGRALAATLGELGIGADTTLGAVLPGKLDLVRLWRLARDGDAIASARHASLARQPGLVAEWTMDGHGRDLVGGHDGEALGGASFSFDGAQPRDVLVPLITSSVQVDGRCDPSEYGSAARAAVDTLSAPRVLLQATASDVYACLAGLPRTGGLNGNAALYVDRNGSGAQVAEAGDLRIMISARGTVQTDEGDGRGGWRRIELLDADWDAARDAPAGTVNQEVWSAEFRIRRALLDRPAVPDRPAMFRAAVGASDRSTTAVDAFWPHGTLEASPATWAMAELADEAGIPPRTTFEGRVIRLQDGGRDEGLAGAIVQLLALDEDRLTLVDEVVTDGGGRWTLGYPGALPDAFVVREIDPRGATSVRAAAGADGEARGANALYYAMDPGEETTSARFAGATFVDAVALAEPSPLDRHFLVVYAPPVTEDDLAELLRARRLQGFATRSISTTELDRSVAGRDLAEKVQRWLRDRWTAVDDDGEPVYALLVGRGDAIPVRDIGWHDNDHRDPDGPGWYPAWPTDWYYADLDSGWDANGNGFHGELLRCPPGMTYPDPEADDGVRDCPEAGSLTREGPFGALRGPEDDFVPDIAVGRLAVNTPAEVRAAVRSALAAEADGGAAKHRALLAGAFRSFEGRSRLEAERRFVPGGSAGADPWLRAPWDGTKPFGDDTAEDLDARALPVLRGGFRETYRLYETTAPSGDPSLAPSRRAPEGALSRAALEERWQLGRAGLVLIAGLGAPDAILAPHWVRDWDGNGQIEQPNSDLTCAGRPIPELGTTGPPCPELWVERLIDGSFAVLSGAPPVVVANAGGTGAVAYELEGLDARGGVTGLRYGPPALAGAMPVRGAAAAWLGALGSVAPGALDDYQAEVARGLVATSPLRLGDAAWQAAAALASAAPHDMRSYGMVLFGDPAASYWGNAADTAGAWPQDGGSWHARGSSGRSGPMLPEVAWGSPPAANASPPVVDRAGTLYAASGADTVRIAPSGVELARGSVAGLPPAQTPFAPAASADGVFRVYGDRLLRFDGALAHRDTQTLPGPATGAPRIDGDGAVWVPTIAGMVRATATALTTFGRFGPAIGPAVVLPTGAVAWSSSRGTIVRWSPVGDGAGDATEIAGPGIGQLTDLAAGADGTLFAGSDDGRLYAFPPDRAPWNARVGGVVAARPTIAGDGTLFAASRAGTVVAFAPGSPIEAWREVLPGAIVAPLAVDGAHVYAVAGDALYALDVATGARSWAVPLGGAVDGRSAPVIGAERALYVTRADGSLLALRDAGWAIAPSGVTLDTAQPAEGATISWRDNSTGETGFRVWLCLSDGACADVGTTAPNATRLVVGRLPTPPGAAVWARVQALGGGGAAGFALQPGEAGQGSELADSVLALPAAAGSPAPSAVRAEVQTAERVRLTWSVGGDTAGLLGFTIRRAAPGEAFVDVAVLPADARRFVDRGLRAATRYEWEVVADFEFGQSAAPSVSATTLARANRGPLELRALPGQGDVLLTWRDEVPDEMGWLIERRAPGTAHYDTVGRLEPGATRFVDRLWLAEGFYHYRVYATLDGATSQVAEIGVDVTSVARTSVFLPYAAMRR